MEASKKENRAIRHTISDRIFLTVDFISCCWL